MISIVRYLSESQAWERQPNRSPRAFVSLDDKNIQNRNILANIKKTKVNNYLAKATKSAGNMFTSPRVGREYSGMSKHNATFPV